MIIFTGTGRSGIEFYSRLFDTNHQYNVKELARHFPPTNITLDTAPFKDLSTRVKIMRDHLKGVDIKTFRDSSNPYVSFLDALYEIDNNIKIVLGVRDGRDFVRSGITRGYHNENKYSGYSKTPCRDDPYFPLWTNMTPVERMAWMWNFRNSKALECLEHVPKENWMIVRLEDLTANEEKSKYWIEMLEDFLCLKASRGWLKKKCNASKKLEFPPVVEWNKETTQGFDRIAGKLMLTLGYNNKLPDHTINEDKSTTLIFESGDWKYHDNYFGGEPYGGREVVFFKGEPIYIMVYYGVVDESVSDHNKVYGILSVLLQAFYDVEYLFTVSETVFDPPPKVKSAVIRLVRKEKNILNCNEKLLFQIVKATFNHRRKIIRNTLKSVVGELDKNIENELLLKRPEQLGVEDFNDLTNFAEKMSLKNDMEGEIAK